ncbi:unnamed protein product [Lepeophtheirus salmonis]|uniref:(salmon louse) hypothetical protein n=1 Tax=Lepeophtheirus salmonis TaxID=72036 RepID=A0A7R8CKA5_LEPSM|nr:unnamed protein product [Lepeophtheirus salmonis]CAF2847914.1 unnamed protein product [Lepeophtheirus salmonis]
MVTVAFVEHSKQLGVSRTIVYAVSKSKTLEKKKGSVKKVKLNPEELKKTAKVNPLMSRDNGVSYQTNQRENQKNGWEESFESVEATFDTKNEITPSPLLKDSFELF